MVGHTGAVTKAHSTGSTTELGAQADGMQPGCTARRVSFRILLERAAAESLCAAEGLRARTHSGYKALVVGGHSVLGGSFSRSGFCGLPL